MDIAHGDESDSSDGESVGDELIDLPAVDLHVGKSVGGHCRVADIAMAAKFLTPNTGRRSPKFHLFTWGACVAAILVAFFAIPKSSKKNPPEAPRNGGSTDAFYFYGGGMVAFCGFFALYRRILKRFTMPWADMTGQYVFQEECFYWLGAHELNQVAWRDPMLWKSETLLGLQNKRAIFPLPRRFCRDEQEWTDLISWFQERIYESSATTPDGYDGTGRYEEIDYREGWTRDLESPVFARSSRSIGSETYSLTAADRSFRRLMIGSVTAAAAALGIGLSLNHSGIKLALFSFAAMLGMAAACRLWVRSTERRQETRNAGGNSTQYVLRGSCLESVGEDWRSIYRWEGLSRVETGEKQIILSPKRVPVLITLPRIAFSDADWQKVVTRANSLTKHPMFAG